METHRRTENKYITTSNTLKNFRYPKGKEVVELSNDISRDMINYKVMREQIFCLACVVVVLSPAVTYTT